MSVAIITVNKCSTFQCQHNWKILLILNSLNDFLFLFFLFSLSHKDEFTIIPVLVGALSESKEQEFGKLFSKYLADPSNLFVVSSDFCHWGKSQILTYGRCYVFVVKGFFSFQAPILNSCITFHEVLLQQPCLEVNKQLWSFKEGQERGEGRFQRRLAQLDSHREGILAFEHFCQRELKPVSPIFVCIWMVQGFGGQVWQIEQILPNVDENCVLYWSFSDYPFLQLVSLFSFGEYFLSTISVSFLSCPLILEHMGAISTVIFTGNALQKEGF